MDLCALEIPLAQARKLQKQLEEKRADYFSRIRGSNGSWDQSWSTRDLLKRHDDDIEFRLRYYKFVLISIVLIACEKAARKELRSDDGFDGTVNTKCVGTDLSMSLDRNVDTETFNVACEVINDYVTGVRPLSETQSIP